MGLTRMRLAGRSGRCEHRPDPHGVCAGIVAKQALKFFAAKAVPNLDVTPAMLAACGEMLEAAVRVRDARESAVTTASTGFSADL